MISLKTVCHCNKDITYSKRQKLVKAVKQILPD